MPQTIHRTEHPSSATIQDMRINHRGADIPRAQQFLNRANIIAVFQSRCVANEWRKYMGTRRLCQLYFPGRLFQGSLENGFVQMMPVLDPGARINADLRGRKHPLPAPLVICIWILARQRPR